MKPVSILQCGNCTPVGSTAAISASSIRSGFSALMRHPDLKDSNGQRITLALTRFLELAPEDEQRFVKLASRALAEAVSPLVGTIGSTVKTPLLIGLPSNRPGVSEYFYDRLSNELYYFGLSSGIRFDIELFPFGQASSLMALEKGMEWLFQNRGEFCIVGGIDSYLHPATLAWLEQEEWLHCSSNKFGFVPGEAAGFCLLARPETVAKYRWESLATLYPPRVLAEQTSPNGESDFTGETLSAAISQVLTLANVREKIAGIYCTLNGDRRLTDEYGFLVPRLHSHFFDMTCFQAPVTSWGEIGAAAAPSYLNLIVQSGKRGYAAGALNLIMISSIGERRGAVLVELPHNQLPITEV